MHVYVQTTTIYEKASTFLYLIKLHNIYNLLPIPIIKILFVQFLAVKTYEQLNIELAISINTHV